MLIRLGVLAVAFGAAAAVAFAAAPAAMRLDALTRIQNTIAHPPDASALERVRTYGLDPHDPDLARKLVPIEARARADAAATVAKRFRANAIRVRFEPPANARAKAARPVLVPGWAGQVKAIGGRVPPPAVGDGPVMLAVAVNGVPVPGEPDLWPGDDVTIHAAGASGAAAGIVLGDCGGWTTASTVRDNADRTQDISFTVGSGDAAIPIGDPVGHGTLLLRRGALRSPAIPVTLHAQMAHLVLAASVGPRVAQPSGTRLFSGNPLGLVEGVNTYTHLPPDDRTQFIGPDYSGTDTFGSDLHLIHGFTARASVRVLYNDYGRAVVLHGPSGRDFVTTVMWTVGGSFLDTSTVGYEVSWDLVGPAYGRPLSSIASTARTSCDLAWPIWQRGDGFSYAPSQRF